MVLALVPALRTNRSSLAAAGVFGAGKTIALSYFMAGINYADIPHHSHVSEKTLLGKQSRKIWITCFSVLSMFERLEWLQATG